MSVDSDDDSIEYILTSPSILREKLALPKQNVFLMQVQRYNIFKTQDPANGNFDLTLEFGDGKNLFVHKFHITSVSETFDAMLSTRWANGEKVIKVENYSYNDFFEFVSFLYSGDCKLTEANVFEITDMAEYYGVSTLKNYCDLFLSKMLCKEENLFDWMEFGHRYSLEYFNQSLQCFYFNNFFMVVKSQKFITLNKSCVEMLATIQRESGYQEYHFFDNVCKWAKHQALLKKNESEEVAIFLPNDVKEELSEILPHIKFDIMPYSNVSTFVEDNRFLFTLNELYEILLGLRRSSYFRDDENLLTVIYELAEKEIKGKTLFDESVNFNDAIKAELSELFPRIHFNKMSFKFLAKFLVDKQFLFSQSELYKIFVKCERSVSTEEGEVFKTVYEMAENHALEKQKISCGENFDLNETIKNELAEFLDDFFYYNMSSKFILEFIVPKKFLFASKKLYNILGAAMSKGEVEKLFDAIYELAESEASEKQLSSENLDFNLQNAIKEELVDILPKIIFSRMKFDYVAEKILDKRFLFSASELYKQLLNSIRTPEQEEEFFKVVVELAEKYASEKQEKAPAENFDLKVAAKEELTGIIRGVEFSLMKLDFLTNFVVKKGFTFNTVELYKFFVDCRNQFDSEEKLFEAIYGLAEGQAQEKGRTTIDENFNVVDTIKADLAQVLPFVQFYKMDKIFVENFVVKNGILSDDEVRHIFGYRVVVENNGKTLTGAFVDDFGIKNALGSNGYRIHPRATYKQRFTRLKFTVPSTPSTLERMKGGHWYLLLEKDGVLTIKIGYSAAKSDYLIAEMRSQEDFHLMKGSPTTIRSYTENESE